MKITPDILKKIGKGAKDLMLKTIKVAKKATGGDKATTEKFTKAEAMVNKIPAGKIAKGILTAELGNDLAKSIFEMPVVDKAYGLLQKIDNFRIEAQKATFFKIPIIGPLLQNVAKKSNEVAGTIASVLGLDVLADEAFRVAETINDKSWYLSLGEHVPYVIPTGYPDSYPTRLYFEGNTWPRNRIVVIEGLINFAAQPDKVSQRMNQLFVLLKGVRGLSQVSYTIKDLFNYERCVLNLVLAYYKMCKIIKVTKLYNVMKGKWPDELLTSLNAPTDIDKDLANYENLVFQWKQALGQLPIVGNVVNKVKYLATALLADSNDTLIATYYTYNVAAKAYQSNGSPMTVDISVTSTVSSLTDAFNILLKHVMDNPLYGAIMGDMVGAFGKFAMYDYTYDLKPYELTKCYDELGLSMIQNSYSGRVESRILQSNGFPLNPGKITNKLGTYFNAGGWHFQEENYDSALQSSEIYLMSTEKWENTFEPDNAQVYVAPHQGMKDNVFSVPATNSDAMITDLIDSNPQVIVNCAKYKLDEGESLEIIQNQGYTKAVHFSITHETAPNEDDATYALTLISRTGFLAITDITSNYYPRGLKHIDYVISAPDASGVKDIADACTLWSQADWAPKLVLYIIGKESSGQILKGNSTLWDSNVFGYLAGDTLDIGIGYTFYSLYAPNVKAGGKTIDNIRDIYNTK